MLGLLGRLEEPTSPRRAMILGFIWLRKADLDFRQSFQALLMPDFLDLTY